MRKFITAAALAVILPLSSVAVAPNAAAETFAGHSAVAKKAGWCPWSIGGFSIWFVGWISGYYRYC